MMTMKSILKTAMVYLICVAAIGGGIYFSIGFFGQKTLYLEKKQWRPAEPETQHIDTARLNKALDYVETRMPTARSLLILRNGKTVVEKYYWHGGPQETDYLHSLNLPLLQILIGIAIDQGLIQGPEQPLAVLFRNHPTHLSSEGRAPLTLRHLLRTQGPLLWGGGNPAYWDLFYARDRIEASLNVIHRQRTQPQSAVTFAAAYLMSQVIEHVSDQSVFGFADRHLFKPLGITTYADDDTDLPKDALVGFQLKALDLAKIGYLLTKEGAWDGQQIVSRKWVSWLLSKAPICELDASPGGSWVKTSIAGHESLMVHGDGGQYLVLVPELRTVVVATSTNRFALPPDNGHDRLLQMLIGAVLEQAGPAERAEGQKLSPVASSEQRPDSLSPNYVFSTPVPQDILDFFHGFAQDIISKDTRRIAENYARAYDHSRDMFASPSRLLLAGSAPHLEYVHITKIRIEKNRAYLRGRLKFAHRTYAGPQGVYPLENLIKLKGRWRWLGLPKKTALLDRDDYFGAELSEAHQRFIETCSGALFGNSPASKDGCFSDTFELAAGGREQIAERLQPFLRGRPDVRMHVTGMQRRGAAYQVQGYIDGTALGELRLPDDLHITRENGAWKWIGRGNSIAAMPSGREAEKQ